MNRRIIYGLFIAAIMLAIGVCGDKFIKTPEKEIISEPTIKEIDEQEEVEEEEEQLYYGLTYESLVAQIDKSLNSTVSGYGEQFVSKSLELGVDPYLAVAIMLHETGCKWNCSKLVKNCNNVGGMKTKNKCKGSSYGKFATLEDGIDSYISYLHRAYVSKGMDTPEEMQRKYTGKSSGSWAKKVNNYIKEIKSK